MLAWAVAFARASPSSALARAEAARPWRYSQGGDHRQRLGDHRRRAVGARPVDLPLEELARLDVVAEHERGEAGPEQAPGIGRRVDHLQRVPQAGDGGGQVPFDPVGHPAEEARGERVARRSREQLFRLPAHPRLPVGVTEDHGGLERLQQQLLRAGRVARGDRVRRQREPPVGVGGRAVGDLHQGVEIVDVGQHVRVRGEPAGLAQ